MAGNKKKDPISGVETTGHEWDGLEELNNPAPRWWLWVFVVTVIWSVGYWVFYPAWPTLTGATKGTGGWTQYRELQESQQQITNLRDQYAARFSEVGLDDIANDPALYEFARAGGAAAFKENCAACHGTGAAGGNGYPNLNDDDWLWGGTLADIHETLRVGVNSGHADQRGVPMPAFGRDGILNRAQIDDVVAYVADLHKGEAAPQDEQHARGKQVFAENCASCHGVNGEGGREFGAPRLNDDIWLWGGSTAAIRQTVSGARAGVMPAWETRLPPDTLKALTVYIHSLGGGEATQVSESTAE